jgi:hypothetical protein
MFLHQHVICTLLSQVTEISSVNDFAKVRRYHCHGETMAGPWKPWTRIDTNAPVIELVAADEIHLFGQRFLTTTHMVKRPILRQLHKASGLNYSDPSVMVSVPRKRAAAVADGAESRKRRKR